MIIIETQFFTKRVQVLLTDEEYRDFQNFLVEHPEIGTVIKGSGGLRKVRWVAKGHGKRGGSRVIYYWAVENDRLLMLFIFAKNEQDDLSADQLKMLRRIVEDEYP
jgi:hypothetical protein